MLQNFRILWQANQDGGAGAGGGANGDDGKQGEKETQQETPKDFVEWLESQSDVIKGVAKPLFDTYTKDLQSAVKATRKERDDFSRQLRDASKKLEEGSTQKIELDKLADSLEKANQKADFYESAPAQECRNPKAAYAIALAEGLFDRHGVPDWKEIKAQAPELFGVKNVVKKRTAGSGAEGDNSSSGSMSDWIRNSVKKTTVDL